MSGTVRAFTTDGYYVVAEKIAEALSILRPESVSYRVSARLDYLGAQDRLFVKFDVLTEDRANGTVLTHNSTNLGTLAGHYTRQWTNDTISLLGYHTRQEYHASFSAVSADRNTETITFLQTVPAEAVGGAGMWRHHARSWNLLAGADAQRVEGTSTDALVRPVCSASAADRSCSTELLHSLMREPRRQNCSSALDISSREPTSRFFSPSGGFALGRGMLRARGSVYRAFRAPTLNELFRDFRAGNTETRSNPALLPETLFGAEVGFDVVAENAHFGVSLYRNQIG